MNGHNTTRAAGRIIAGAVLATVILIGAAAPAAAQEAIYIVRHAERIDDQPQSLLSPDGHARAARLADILRDAGITAIFASEYERTRQTGQPTATRLGLSPGAYKADDTPGLVAALRAQGPRARVLVVGHSDTVPKLLAALGYQTPVTIAKGEFDNLFIVQPPRSAGEPPIVIRLHY